MSIAADQFLEYCYVFKVPVNGHGGGGGGSSATALVASTANLVGTYNNGAAGVGATITLTATGTFQLDGVTPSVNSVVLLKNQTTSTQNGLYTVTVNAVGVQGVLTRAATYDTAAEINSIGLIIVQAGNTLAGESFYLTAPVTTVGTSPINYAAYALGVTSVASDGSINVSSPVGAVTITLPQSVATTATPTFVNTKLSSLTVNGVATVASDKSLTTVAPGPSGSTLTSNGTTWTSSAPVTAANNTLVSNISGGVALPVSNTFSAFLDSAVSSQPNTLINRNATAWVGLPSSANSALITDNTGALEYVTKLPAELIPIDHYSLNVEYGKPFLDYNLTPTGIFPLQMVAFKRFVTVINNISNTLQTYQILASGIVTSLSTIATGGNPQAIVYLNIAGADYVAVTNAADNTFQLYLWDGSTFFSAVGSPIATLALSPRGIAYNLISGTPSLTVAGYNSNTVQLFKWNGTTFTSTSAGVSTGTAPGSAVGFDFAGASYLAVVNTTQATASIYTYVGSDWLIFQTVSTNSTPLSLIMFNFNSTLFLAVACSIGNSIQIFKLSGGTFVASASATSAGVPVSIDSFVLDGVCYVSVVGTLSSALRTYIFDPVAGTLIQDGSDTATGGTTPADMVAYRLINTDGSYTQYISVTNSLSDNMTTFYYADGLISVAPIQTGNILANLSATTDVPIGNTFSNVLDFVFTSVQGSVLYRSSAGWTYLAPGPSGDFLQSQGTGADLTWAAAGGLPAILNNELMANISGSTAVATGVTVSAYFDSALSSLPNSLILRSPTAWGVLASVANSGLQTNAFGTVAYVTKFANSLIPVDNVSIIAPDPYSFISYAASVATSNTPTQLAFFSTSPTTNYISVISNGSNNVRTYSVSSSNTVTFLSTTGTGTSPKGIVSFSISGTYYVAVTNSTANSIRVYSWNAGLNALVAIGGDIFSIASVPTGISFNVLAGTPTLTVVGNATNSILRFTWNGTTFLAAGATVATGASPTLSDSASFSGTEYLAVANSGASTVSVYTFSGTAWVLLQTLTTAANPVDVAFFVSGGNLFLSSVSNTGNQVQVFELVTGSFVSSASATSANNPSGVTYTTLNSLDFIVTVGTAGNTLDLWQLDYVAGNLSLASSTSCGGTAPAGVLAYTVSGLNLVSVSNSTSNTMTNFQLLFRGISLAPIPSGNLLCNLSGTSSTPLGNTVSALFDSVIGSTVGMLIVRTGGGWVALSPTNDSSFLCTTPSSGLQWLPPRVPDVSFFQSGTLTGVTTATITTVASVVAGTPVVASISSQTSSVFITSYTVNTGNVVVNFSGTITAGIVTLVANAGFL